MKTRLHPYWPLIRGNTIIMYWTNQDIEMRTKALWWGTHTYGLCCRSSLSNVHQTRWTCRSVSPDWSIEFGCCCYCLSTKKGKIFLYIRKGFFFFFSFWRLTGFVLAHTVIPVFSTKICTCPTIGPELLMKTLTHTQSTTNTHLGVPLVKCVTDFYFE